VARGCCSPRAWRRSTIFRSRRLRRIVSPPGWRASARRGRRSTSASSCSSRGCGSRSTAPGSTGTRSSAGSPAPARPTRSEPCSSGCCSRRLCGSWCSTRTRTSRGSTRSGTGWTKSSRRATGPPPRGSRCGAATRRGRIACTSASSTATPTSKRLSCGSTRLPTPRSTARSSTCSTRASSAPRTAPRPSRRSSCSRSARSSTSSERGSGTSGCTGGRSGRPATPARFRTSSQPAARVRSWSTSARSRAPARRRSPARACSPHSGAGGPSASRS